MLCACNYLYYRCSKQITRAINHKNVATWYHLVDPSNCHEPVSAYAKSFQTHHSCLGQHRRIHQQQSLLRPRNVKRAAWNGCIGCIASSLRGQATANAKKAVALPKEHRDKLSVKNLRIKSKLTAVALVACTTTCVCNTP